MMSHSPDVLFEEYLSGSSWSGIIFEAHDGKTAIEVANSHQFNLVFLDIVIPDATGLEVIEHLDYKPKMIFTTAHDRYTVTAFELNALDYLLKPFGRDRFDQVLHHAQ